MRILIKIDDIERKSPESIQAIKSQLVKFGFRPSHKGRRLEKRGILSGDLDPNLLDDVRDVTGVAFIETDRVRRTI